MKTAWTPERVRAIRVRGWRRYVKHWCHTPWSEPCWYGTRCQIAREQNHRDAILGGLEQRLAPRQSEMGL